MAAVGGELRLTEVGGQLRQWRVQDLVQVISESGATTVPPQYIVPLQKLEPVGLEDVTTNIPVIDLAGTAAGAGGGLSSRRELIATQIANACEDWGFFQVVNHGIPAPLIDSARRVARSFFALPVDERLKYSMDSCAKEPCGYGRNYDFEGVPLNWVDILRHNISPPNLTNKDLWPALPTDYKDTIEAYGKEVINLIHHLLCIISENLGLKPTSLQEAAGESTFTIRTNYYPSCPEPNLVAGLMPHSDASIITVLQQEVGVKGLQVQKGENWYEVEPLEGALVINIGDMLELMSNGKYRSVIHRSMTNSEGSRLSIVVFETPHLDSLLCPPRELLKIYNQPRFYKDITCKDYMNFHVNASMRTRQIIRSLKVQPNPISCTSTLKEHAQSSP